MKTSFISAVTAMQRFFISSAIVILLLSAVAKFVSATGTARILSQRDPLIGLSYRRVLLFGAAIESVTVVALLATRVRSRQLATLAWLSLLFAAYRVGSALIGAPRLCPCLGTISEALHLPAVIVNRTMSGVFLYLIIGSFALLVWELLQAKIDGKHHKAGSILSNTAS